MELSDIELELILSNMGGFSDVETMMLCSSITTELAHRKETAELDFEDCLSCKL